MSYSSGAKKNTISHQSGEAMNRLSWLKSNAPLTSLLVVFSSTCLADLDRAELFKNACQTCHSNQAGEAHRQGPNLFGIFGKKAGQAKGFNYSPALSSSDIEWTEKNLDRWLSDPQELIPGNVMAYSQRRPERRQALIEHLKTLK
jgi:cytochrome c